MPKRKPHLAGRPQKAPTTKTADDTKPGTIYFYLPNQQPYGIFSQWHPSRIIIPTTSLAFLTTSSSATASTILTQHAPRITFSSAEQAFMFSKALFFADAHSCTRILVTKDPKEQKKLGKAVDNFSEHEWTRVKSRVAEVGNWYKFLQDEGMREVLVGTGERELAEASRVDRVWGIGFQEAEAEASREAWGENRLGRALMRVRGRLKMMGRWEAEGKVVYWEWDGGEDEWEGEREGGLEEEGLKGDGADEVVE